MSKERSAQKRKPRSPHVPGRTCARCGKPLAGLFSYAKRKYCSQECMGLSYRKTPAEALAGLTDKGPHPKGCWLFTGSIKPRNGYGHMRIQDKDYNAHRLAYELAKGEIPEGLSVMHACDVPHCVNPEHLSVGTHQENMADCLAKGRRKTKLTAEQVQEIRRRAETESNKELAEEFGVTWRQILTIKKRRQWKHVP